MRAALVLLALTSGLLAGITELQSLVVDFEVACHLVADLNADGRDELILIGTDGEIRVWVHDREGGGYTGPVGELYLLYPESSLLTLADLTHTGGPPQLIAATPRGVFAYTPDSDGTFREEPQRLARRARFDLRTGKPMLAPITPDVNRDGRADLVIPDRDKVELWMDDAEGNWRSTARIDVRVREVRRARGDALSDELGNLFTIPQLRTYDVNGDTRPDLLVEDGNLRAFHLQAEDGSFPSSPTASVDLGMFRDTSPGGGIKPGRTLAGGDRTSYQARDLDDDGIPDYVLAHRRKVWVFHGSSEGPQFTEPSTVLKVADDVTALILVRLDDDAFPDLVLLKVQVPTVATLILGMVSEWDVEITALGYRNEGGRAFETRPGYKSEIIVRLPAILDILKDANALIERVREIDRSFQQVLPGDFDGDGQQDLVLWELDESETGSGFEVWFGNTPSEESEMVMKESEFKRLLFEDEERIWTLERILDWMASLASQRSSVLTGERPPDETMALRSLPFLIEGLRAADVDGDGRQELVAIYRETGDVPRFHIDVLGVRDGRD